MPQLENPAWRLDGLSLHEAEDAEWMQFCSSLATDTDPLGPVGSAVPGAPWEAPAGLTLATHLGLPPPCGAGLAPVAWQAAPAGLACGVAGDSLVPVVLQPAAVPAMMLAPAEATQPEAPAPALPAAAPAAAEPRAGRAVRGEQRSARSLSSDAPSSGDVSAPATTTPQASSGTSRGTRAARRLTGPPAAAASGEAGSKPSQAAAKQQQGLTKQQIAANKRKAPEIDWRSIDDPAERRRQRRLAKNRITAARSRERKKEQIQEMEGRMAELEAENDSLKAANAALMAENAALKAAR